MDILNAIKHFRIEKKMKQSDIKLGKSTSTLSRIETGERSLRTDDLELIIEGLGVSENEFFAYAIASEEQNGYVAQVRKASKNPSDTMLKKFIFENYFREDFRFSKSMKELSRYYTIKVHFYLKWDLKKLNQEEIDHVFNQLVSQEYYGQYAYNIFMNMIYHFDKTQTNELFSVLFPLKNEHLHSQETKKFAYNGVINAITRQIYEKKYDEAKKYIEVAETIDVNNTNYFFRLSILYLKNIVLYLETKSMMYQNKIYSIISLIRDIKDDEIADAFEAEVKDILFTDKSLSIDEVDPVLIKEE